MESGRGTISITPGYWRNPFIGTGQNENRQRSTKCQKDAKACTKAGFDFLNTHFTPYPVVKFSDLYSQENYDFLYRSAKNYLKLLGKDIGIKSDGYDFIKLYQHFNLALPEHQECELYRHADTIYLHVIENNAGWELYYIPCAVIHRVNPVLSDIFIDFFRLFQHTQKLAALKEDPVYEIFIGDTGHYALKDKEERKKLTENYKNGHIGEILDKIAEEPVTSITKLKNRIKKYDPRPEEAGIIALMLEGLELFRRKEAITKHTFFPYETEDYYNCYWPVEADRTLMIIYDKDMLSEFISEWITEEAQEQSAEIYSAGSKIITPWTRAPLKINQYVIDFFNWIKRFEYELYDL